MKTTRCAIYTRKSSDEGLEQGFNSLDAQREACAAYILSQASEGWSALPDRYDDGGISGGTLERPALKCLLADVAAGKVDVIVVYKVDRLSRSLFDFAKLVEIFEKAGTSFVSITQSFNTTSSMGRLTLNMLLSFAQFEREVTAERIRDKIAASKAKGMWMGGNAPIGYAPDGRSLTIVEQDANLVRMLYRRYLEAGSVFELQEQLLREGVLTPKRETRTGRQMGAVPFARTQIYKILSNPLYLGVIPHQGKTYPGQHAAIIDQDLWDRVQARLAANLQGRRQGRAGGRSALLAGRIVEEGGRPMTSVHASKHVAGGGEGRVRYNYYASSPRQSGASSDACRIPAREADALVLIKVAELLEDPLSLQDQPQLSVSPDAYRTFELQCAVIAARVRARDYELVRDLLSQVRVLNASVEIDLNVSALAAATGAIANHEGTSPLSLSVPVRLTRSGMAMRLIQGGKAIAGNPDPALLRIIVRARGYWQELRKGQLSITELAERNRINAAYITRILRLAFLSPAIIDAVIAGRQPAALNARRLVGTDAIDGDWKIQSRTLLAVQSDQ